MQIMPRDLSSDRYLSVLYRRFSHQQNNGQVRQVDTAPSAVAETRSTRLSRLLSRRWTRGLDLKEEEAETLGSQIWSGPTGVGMRVGFSIVSVYLVMFSALALLAHGFPPAIPFTIFLVWLGLGAMVVSGPRKQIQKADEKPLTVAEVEAMLPHARGRLDRLYLNLLLDAVRQEVPSVSAQADIRVALHALGEVISKLPADPVAVVAPDALRQQAQQVRHQALYEADSVVQASLNRQAEALERRASLGEQGGTGARRTSALRREVRAQMDSLRAVLAGYSQGANVSNATVSQLSDAVTRVASEATAVAVAHRELDDLEIERLLGYPAPPVEAIPIPKPVVQQPTPQTVQPQQPAKPPVQQVGSRRWWTGGNVG